MTFQPGISSALPALVSAKTANTIALAMSLRRGARSAPNPKSVSWMRSDDFFGQKTSVLKLPYRQRG